MTIRSPRAVISLARRELRDQIHSVARENGYSIEQLVYATAPLATYVVQYGSSSRDVIAQRMRELAMICTGVARRYEKAEVTS